MKFTRDRPPFVFRGFHQAPRVGLQLFLAGPQLLLDLLAHDNLRLQHLIGATEFRLTVIGFFLGFQRQSGHPQPGGRFRLAPQHLLGDFRDQDQNIRDVIFIGADRKQRMAPVGDALLNPVMFVFGICVRPPGVQNPAKGLSSPLSSARRGETLAPSPQ